MSKIIYIFTGIIYHLQIFYVCNKSSLTIQYLHLNQNRIFTIYKCVKTHGNKCKIWAFIKDFYLEQTTVGDEKTIIS